MVDKAKYVARLKELHRAKTGSELLDADALEQFEKLVLLVSLVYRPIPSPYGIDWITVP